MSGRTEVKFINEQLAEYLRSRIVKHKESPEVIAARMRKDCLECVVCMNCLGLIYGRAFALCYLVRSGCSRTATPHVSDYELLTRLCFKL